MKACKENLNKLKNLCEQLNNRDAQLKINAHTLWSVIEKVEAAKKILIEGSDIELAVQNLNDISVLINHNKCKKVIDDE